MAAQAALIADTITGMKRALRREREGEYLLDLASKLDNVFTDVFLFFSFARLRPGRSYHATDEPWEQNAIKCEVCS
jgi:hypothetical protein